MKFLKVSLLIITPIVLASMLSNSIYNIADSMHLLEHGLNYLPLFGAIAFFAFWLFLVPTANLIFPNKVTTSKEKPEIPACQPCTFFVGSHYDYNTSIYASINICHE